ncbi:enoyl-CoA hydratase [Pseudovibrio sp. Tun.PSC04-5.I4]|uniref:oxepin-CoA hydrolase, alternative type n=1 Tax=Pseudovibrio sp. Tun.PSC04-5.I4 TaxID=1798213 RepID=UPI00088D2753|nr:enoyl-CoA hydratase [Pseudovibrio sp. Tun.PSC04-5.I4]SDR14285.1 Enoyl-CoA hydratase/carnithine racemase [Pseudovibrio sp. Tun.PSC04-5.I4]
MNTSSLVDLQRQGDRLVVTNCNRSRRNALSPDYYEGLHRALDLADEDDGIRCVILTGEGGYFCAGGDLNSLVKRREVTISERKNNIEKLHDLVRRIRSCSKPVIAAVGGGAAGAGVSLALACDLIVADRDAQFMLAYVKVGLVPDGGAIASLAQLIPRQLMSEMCLLGQPVGAERLYHLGVVNVLADADSAFAQACLLADRIGNGPRQAQGHIKRMVEAAGSNSFCKQMDLERDTMAKVLGGDEAQEGINAFLERRQPCY